jgi:hypothetical protein
VTPHRCTRFPTRSLVARCARPAARGLLRAAWGAGHAAWGACGARRGTRHAARRLLRAAWGAQIAARGLLREAWGTGRAARRLIGAPIAARGLGLRTLGLLRAACGLRLAACGLRHTDCRARLASPRHGLRRALRLAARWAVVAASSCGLRRDLRCRGGTAPAQIMLASSRRFSAPARPGGPARRPGPWTTGSGSGWAARPPLSCPAPPPSSPVHLHIPNLFQFAEYGRRSPRTARAARHSGKGEREGEKSVLPGA